MRLDVADIQNLRKPDDYKFMIVTEFPQFEWSEEEHRFMATHHPFTMPFEEDVQYLLTDKARVRAQAYDVVLNGIELGSEYTDRMFKIRCLRLSALQTSRLKSVSDLW